MNRITEKNGVFYKLKPENEVYGWEDGIRLVQIVGKLEDLEEQLGCPLEVVFKAIKDGVYYEDVANYMIYLPVDLHFNLEGDYILYYDDEDYLLTKDYQKTWWLKEDKSE